ncbi:hypothetical protein AB0M35_15100 [Micromonospora sp. NPDC051196]|uniref:effector-associated constant component EACC1 n=1 Tax=Micromonospora sp. NPDC051196 TaxID=3155281 RepID=UPI0034423924
MVLTPEDTSLEPGDWQWGEQSRLLVRLLQAYDLDARQRVLPPESGEKGLATEIILVLSGSGAVGAATTVLLTWLNARSTRRLTLTVGSGADRRTVKVVGEGLSDSSMRAALLAALGHQDMADGADGDAAEGLQPAEEQ